MNCTLSDYLLDPVYQPDINLVSQFEKPLVAMANLNATYQAVHEACVKRGLDPEGHAYDWRMTKVYDSLCKSGNPAFDLEQPDKSLAQEFLKNELQLGKFLVIPAFTAKPLTTMPQASSRSN